MENHRENNKKTHNAQQEVIQTQNNFAVDAIVIDDDENDDVIIITPPSSPAHGNIVTIDLTDSSDVPDGSPPNETDQLEGAAGPKTEEEKNADLECPICLQICVHPTRLPCGHIFCFLCIKGVAYKSKRCAMCRRDIPEDYMDHPDLINGAKDIKETRSHENGYQWFYEGRNGICAEIYNTLNDTIEKAYDYHKFVRTALKLCHTEEFNLNGKPYLFDFGKMTATSTVNPYKILKLHRFYF